MLSNLDLRLKLLSETAVILENEEKIRNLCGDILACADKSQKYNALCRCRQKLRKLENEKCIQTTECTMKSLDLGKLIENICLGSDIILSQIGKTVTCTAQRQTISCCGSIIIDAFLNLVSNAARFSKTEQINVSVFSKAHEAVIVVENDGFINFDFKNKKGGIAAAQNAALLHNGRLLFAQSDNSVRAFMSVSKLLDSKDKYDVPDFSSFLADDFSPVHIGLSDAIDILS